MLLLETNGLSGSYAHRIFAKYGSMALEILRQDPYRLIKEVEGIGFKTADNLAMSSGMAVDAPERIASGIKFALSNTAQAGHCCVPEELIVNETAKLLAVERQCVAECLSKLLKKGELITEDHHGMILIYSENLYYAKKVVAERLLEIKKQAQPACCWDYEQQVTKWEYTVQIALAKGQRKALISALEHGVLILTGGPGTGKTTTIKGILAVRAAINFKIVLAAPTGRAAKRLSETTEREAATVHRLLEATGGTNGHMFTRNEGNPLDADVIIVDEVSMMDISLTCALLMALPHGCRIVLEGDIDQLPAGRTRFGT